MHHDPNLKATFRGLRMRLGVSVTTAALIVGVGERTVSRWELPSVGTVPPQDKLNELRLMVDVLTMMAKQRFERIVEANPDPLRADTVLVGLWANSESYKLAHHGDCGEYGDGWSLDNFVAQELFRLLSDADYQVRFTYLGTWEELD